MLKNLAVNDIRISKGNKSDIQQLIRVNKNYAFRSVNGVENRLPPAGKISSYPSIIEQSLKLKIMKELVNLDDEKWTEEKASKHKEEMFRILKG